MKETFGTRFARYRKEKGFTQDQMAEKLNVSSQAVSKWENDVNMPDVGLLVKISEIFGITVDTLLGKEAPTPAVFEPEKVKKDFNKLMLRIIVDSSEGDKVRCNLPIALVKMALETGMNPTITGDSKVSSALGSIDWKQVYSMVEQGLLGEIVTVESANGDHVRIVVE